MVALAHRLDRLSLDHLDAPLRREGTGEAGTVLYSGIARVEGVQRYDDIGEPPEYIGPDAIDAFVAAAPGLPVLLGESARGQVLHPGQATGEIVTIRPDNWTEWQVGTVLSAERITLPDGRAAAKVRLAIQDADGIAAIDSGVAAALSADYRLRPSDLRVGPGDYAGQSYDAEQIGGIFNNICLVDSPRGGDACVVRRDATSGGSVAAPDLNAIRDMLTPEILKDPAVRAFVMGLLGIDPAEEATEPPADPMKDPAVASAMDALRADATAQKARADKAEGELAQVRQDAASAALSTEARRLDAALTRARIERPASFDPAKPTTEGNRAAMDALIDSAAAHDPYRPTVARQDASSTLRDEY